MNRLREKLKAASQNNTVSIRTLFFIVLFLYIRERTANRNLNHEVGYVKERLAVMTADLSATEEGCGGGLINMFIQTLQ